MLPCHDSWWCSERNCLLNESTITVTGAVLIRVDMVDYLGSLGIHTNEMYWMQESAGIVTVSKDHMPGTRAHVLQVGSE